MSGFLWTVISLYLAETGPNETKKYLGKKGLDATVARGLLSVGASLLAIIIVKIMFL